MAIVAMTTARRWRKQVFPRCDDNNNNNDGNDGEAERNDTLSASQLAQHAPTVAAARQAVFGGTCC